MTDKPTRQQIVDVNEPRGPGWYWVRVAPSCGWMPVEFKGDIWSLPSKREPYEIGPRIADLVDEPREPGWYLVRTLPNCGWVPAQFRDGFWRWSTLSAEMPANPEPHEIGPRILPPRE